MGAWGDFFSRLRGTEARSEEQGEYIDISPTPAEPSSKPVASAERKNWLPSWPPRGKRERQLEALQNGYTEMIGLVKAIRDHLDRQEAVQEKMSVVLDRLPEAVDGLKSVSRAAEQQEEVLGLLRDREDIVKAAQTFPLARKFDASVDEAILDWIDQNLLS